MTPGLPRPVRTGPVGSGFQLDGTCLCFWRADSGWMLCGWGEPSDIQRGRDWLTVTGLDGLRFARRAELLDAVNAQHAVTPLPPSSDPPPVKLRRLHAGTHTTSDGTWTLTRDVSRRPHGWKVVRACGGAPFLAPTLNVARRMITYVLAADAAVTADR